MQSLVLTSSDGTVAYQDSPTPAPAPGEAVVRLKAAALNRRDYWITKGLYPGIAAPCILGSDGAGVVEAVGDGVDPTLIDTEVVINPGLEWGESEAAQQDTFRILGMPDDGTFAEKTTVPVGQIVPKPAHLGWEEAAALPLAGLTAYRALFTRGCVRREDTVLITGIGGGVAVAALLQAAAVGAKVLVTSSSPEKAQRALALGAAAAADYTQPDWAATLEKGHGLVDLVIDGAGGAGFNDLLGLVRPGGRIVNYGATAGPPAQLDLRRHFWKQLNLLGSTMGSPGDFAAMVQLVEERNLVPVVDSVSPLSEGASVIASMERSPQFGNLVLAIP